LSLHRLTGKRVAIKSIEKSQLKSGRVRQKVFQEVVHLTKVRHPHILRLLEVFESAKHLNLVYEYCPGGNLLNFMRKKGVLNESEAMKLFYQIIRAMNFCHRRGIVHRDIKLDNVLMNEDQNIVR
jgi:NUAK family SNF1-like kinase